MMVALYARVSTAMQAERDLSIPDQLRQMREWCHRQGHAVAMEYVEPGASAMDDRRPVFQQMIADAGHSPQPFDAIVVHSQSRFFRDMVEFAVYERRLTRAGVKVLSITQPTGDDFSGVMLRRVISLFDEYQSRENGKHTLRAMKENARQGYFNGARPAFGYRVEAVQAPGRKGAKKRLAVDEAEAVVVRKVFDLYLTGEHGRELGLLGVARTLNTHGLTYRGKPWYKSRVAAVLTNRMYLGEGVFNRRNRKTARPNAREDWVPCRVPAIVPEATFTRAQTRRQARHASHVPARVVSSPTFLAGLLKCGACGAGMTLATGKSGRYRYYRCGTRVRQGTGCEAGNLPAETLDTAVRRALCDRVFTEERVHRMLEALRRRVEKQGRGSGERVHRLRRELEENQRRARRLVEAVESGALPLDGTLTTRSHELQARRAAILAEIAGLERGRQFPADVLAPGKVKAFCLALRAKLLDPRSDFGRRYLRLLVEEIRVQGRSVVMRGNQAALAEAVGTKNLSTLESVPRFGLGWLPN